MINKIMLDHEEIASVLAVIEKATEDELEKLRIKYLSKKGIITKLVEKIKKIPSEEKAEYGKHINILKKHIVEAINMRKKQLISKKKKKEYDINIPPRGLKEGSLHILTSEMLKIKKILEQLGFTVVEGPEIEDDFYNFQALNFPLNHPSRDTQETFFLENGLLLRTHTTNVQARYLQTKKPPLKIASLGKTYRRDNIDPTHLPMFNQIEGFCVDEKANFRALKGTLIKLLNMYFGKRQLRFRNSYFPFVEPGGEVDIECVRCDGQGCPSCSNSGWLEILGCGMINPKVFENLGLDSDKYIGYAFGIGLERLVLVKYGIKDIRLFYNNDERFLRQFYAI